MSDELSKVLLVEDNPGDARLLREFIAEIDPPQFEITRVERLSEAIQALKARHFDAVLLDLSLPDGHGLSTFDTLHQQVPGVPIVVLTGLDDNTLALSAVQQGAQDYLVKGQVSSALLWRSLRYAIERNRMQAALRNLSIIDDLTGLYNRRGFLTLAQQQIKNAQRGDTKLLLIYADLDKMKQINDNYGHQEGDWALIKVADILRATFRESDIIARLGGDEFTVLATVHPDDDRAELLPRLQNNIKALNEMQARPYEVSLSIGSTCFDPHVDQSLEDRLAQADEALYNEKRAKQQNDTGK